MRGTLTFKSVAKDIIKETISNALFIDDKALEPFRRKSSKMNLKVEHERSIQLYKDFKLNDCLLHIAKFTKRGWRKDGKFNLNNKDLLILDWQLVGEEFDEALKILDQAVLKKGIHFCCIYTQASLEEVKNELNDYYLGSISSEELNKIRETFKNSNLDNFWNSDRLESDWLNFEEKINSIINARSSEINSEINNFQKEYDLDDNQINELKKVDESSLILSFAKIKTALTKTPKNFSQINNNLLSYRASEFDRNTLYINHTIVKLFQKNAVQGSELYEAFLQSFITKEQNIFLSLMGLEMRNRFRETSAFIGKDLDNISEEAFFYHKNFNDNHPELFIEFLRELLKDQVSSFLYEKDLNIFNVLKDYYDSHDGEARQIQFKNQSNLENFITEAYKLNAFYNRLNINHRKTNDALRFGDVFYIKIGETEEFYMCITPHCDCLNPSKLKNQFWFVKGQKVGDTTKARRNVLDGADGRHISFVHFNSSVICIYWENSSLECKPFAFYVPNNKIVDGKLNVYFNDNPLSSEFVDSIKENYAQRIANHAAGYALRIGIDFVKK